MSSIVIRGDTSGAVTLQAPAIAGTTTLTLPTTSGTVIATVPGSTGQILTSTGSAWASADPASQIPAGTVMMYAANSPPIGWLKCNGTNISRTTYATLFGAIGTTYGVGDGSTTFALPDLRGVFARGWDDSRGVDSGRSFGSYQADDFINHQHLFGGDDGIGPQGGYTGVTSFSYDVTHATTGGGQNYRTKNDTSNFGGSETRPKNLALLYIIKF